MGMCTCVCQKDNIHACIDVYDGACGLKWFTVPLYGHKV